MYEYILIRSPNKNKKYRIVTPEFISVDFGQAGASDYTIHKDQDRKYRYISRHIKREYKFWDKSGIQTPSFWSRWLLWNLPTLEESIKDIENKFNINIKNLI